MWRNKGLALPLSTPRRAATPSFHATTLSVLQDAALILLLYVTDRSRCAVKWCNTSVLYVCTSVLYTALKSDIHYIIVIKMESGFIYCS